MKKHKIDPESLLPLAGSVFHILLSLADEERHGYGIMKEVAIRTGGKVRLGPGILYGRIRSLIEDGLIEKSSERPHPTLDDERRVYYCLTDFGAKVVIAEISRLSQLINMARATRLLDRSKFKTSPS